MRDFRRYNGNQGNGNLDPVLSPNRGADSGSGFAKFLVLVGVATAIAYYAFFAQPKEDLQSEDPSVPTGDFLTRLEGRLDDWLDQFDAFLTSLDPPPDTQLTMTLSTDPNQKSQDDKSLQDQSALEEDASRSGVILEYVVVNKYKTPIIMGIIQNSSDQYLDKYEIEVDLGDGSQKIYTGTTLLAFLAPGAKSPFEVRMEDWDGKGKLSLRSKGVRYFLQNIPEPAYDLPRGKWEQSKSGIIYSGRYVNRMETQMRFPQIIIVMRDKSDKIDGIHRYYIALKEEDYTIASGGERFFSTRVFDRISPPHSFEVFFSYLPH